MTGIELAGLEGPLEVEGRDDDIATAARTDRSAFELVYRRHHRAVFRYLRARTSSDDEAAELTAVAFERALGAINRYQVGRGGLLAWLFTIARNAALDAGRSKRRRGLFRLHRDDYEQDPPDPRLA